MKMVLTEYDGLSVNFTEEGWVNATAIAERFGKRVNDFLSLQSTKEYIETLDDEELANTGKTGIWINTKKGKYGGTWLHPDLAVLFARWLSTKFGIWCDRQIRALLTGTHPTQDKKRLRHKTAGLYKSICDILKTDYELTHGKPCPHYIYSNEAAIINQALTGKRDNVDRDSLPMEMLDILGGIQSMVVALLGKGVGYQERKLKLVEHANKLRIELLEKQAQKQLKH